MNTENAKKIISTVQNQNVTLIAVSKYQSDHDLNLLINLGVKNFAENTEQNFTRRAQIYNQVNWHFIGRIQSNKIRKIVANACLIHSVSEIKHLDKINVEAKAINKIQHILIQINLTREHTKAGISIDMITEFLNYANNCSNVKCLGFMIIGNHSDDYVLIQETFKKANQLFNTFQKKFNLSILSMGMSNDYEIAINNNSTHVRIGSKLFE